MSGSSSPLGIVWYRMYSLRMVAIFILRRNSLGSGSWMLSKYVAARFSSTVSFSASNLPYSLSVFSLGSTSMSSVSLSFLMPNVLTSVSICWFFSFAAYSVM